MRPEALPLAGRRVALPETRELDVLEGLFARRGAAVCRCPLVGIVDAPDPAPVLAWLDAFVAAPPDYFIAMTGEGVRRLQSFVERGARSQTGFVSALRASAIVARGPKPARALRALGVPVAHSPGIATTDGVIALLDGIELSGRRVSVQLYGDEPNTPLMEYLERRGAVADSVAPYRYAPESADERIAELVSSLAGGLLDAIVFTSRAQVEHLFRAAGRLALGDALADGLDRTCVAAIGPVVSAALAAHGCRTDVAPAERYFMKPLVAEVCRALTA